MPHINIILSWNYLIFGFLIVVYINLELHSQLKQYDLNIQMN